MNPTISRWVPTTNLMTLRRLGKLIEELGELAYAFASYFCMCPPADAGYDDVREPIIRSITEEIADVIAQCKVTADVIGLDRNRIHSERDRLRSEWTNQVQGGTETNVIETVGTLVNVAGRCIIQGLDAIDPASNRQNRARLEDAIAAVEDACLQITDLDKLPPTAIALRAAYKESLMLTWEGMFTQSEFKGKVPDISGFYWYLPSGQPTKPQVVEVVAETGKEPYFRYTTGSYQTGARHEDRFVGPIEVPT